MTLVVGTHNKDKRREIAGMLRGLPVEVLSLESFPSCPDVVENGRTFEANARKKARFYSRFTGLLTLADDSGLVVPSLNNRPGVYSARFAGEGCAYRDNNQKLLKLLAGQGPAGFVAGAKAQKRQAKFICVMALYHKGKAVGVVRGECRGKIALAEKGRNGFGYDPVFIPNGFSKTFAELSPAVKNKISHRGKALRAARKALLNFLNFR